MNDVIQVREASQFEILRERLRWWVESHLPAAALQDLHHDDPLTGNCLRIHRGGYFTRFSINGRDYFFRRRDGVLDGTGSGDCLGSSCHGRHFSLVPALTADDAHREGG